jgi:hypothetical protein
MTEAPLPFLEGSGQNRLSFEHIDQQYQLKVRSFIGLCMPPTFGHLEQAFDLRGLRAEGTIPIMFFLQFETYPQPLAFGGRVETHHKVYLRRSVVPGPPGHSAGKVERLLLDMHIDVNAREGVADPQLLGARPDIERRMVPAGRMRGVHVLTRPVAPPGQRQVLAVPPQLQGLQEHAWAEPYPSAELLRSVPEGYLEHATGPWHEMRSVWALHNTDVNQHVNVHEYLTTMENHFARQLFGANLPVARHRIARTSILFRKPSFMGDPHALRGALYTDDHHTLMLGGVHRVEPEGGLDPQPSVFARMEGVIEPAG